MKLADDKYKLTDENIKLRQLLINLGITPDI